VVGIKAQYARWKAEVAEMGGGGGGGTQKHKYSIQGGKPKTEKVAEKGIAFKEQEAQESAHVARLCLARNQEAHTAGPLIRIGRCGHSVVVFVGLVEASL